MLLLFRQIFSQKLPKLGMVIKKGDKEVETVGMMSKKDLDAKLNSFLKKDKTIKLDDDYTVGTINQPETM